MQQKYSLSHPEAAILQKVLGYESINTTEIYIEADEEAIHRAHHQYPPL